MHLVMTLLVRDEEDILRANLEAHLALGVDRFIVTDNRSEDRTPAILRAFEQRGLAVVIDEPADDYAQSEWVTRMARLAASDLGADWVINSDADEFWLPAAGNLKSTLASVPSDTNVLVVHRDDFVPRPHDGLPFHERMLVRQAVSLNAVGKPLPPKVCHRARTDIVVEQGNHRVRAPGRGRTLDDGRITIAHFPLRSLEQVRNKIEKGGAAYQRNTTLAPNIGGTWRHLYERLLEGSLDDWYEEQVVDDAGVNTGLGDGSLVVDTRVRDLVRATVSEG